MKEASLKTTAELNVKQAAIPSTILVVEDNADARSMLNIFLSNKGYRVLEASNGLDALDIALSENPDLIITDIRMDIMNGVELIEAIRRNLGAIRSVPIIAMSAYHSSQFLESLRKGANALLPKPFQLEKLTEIVTSLLSQRESFKKQATANHSS